MDDLTQQGMVRRQASEFDQELLDLYDKYCHGLIDRRAFIDGVGKFAVGGVTTASLVAALMPNYALANQVDEKDPRIKTETITFKSPKGNGDTKGYLVRPAKAGTYGAVVVIHENRGLNPYIADVARRLGTAGFIALAPDGLTSLGGYPGNDEEGKAMQRKLDRGKLLQDFIAAFGYLKALKGVNGKVGAVGFCFGGGVVNAMAVRLPDLAAGVLYYGAAPKSGVENIKAPLLIHMGELDKRINAMWPAYEAALKANKKNYQAHVYPKANHGFHNDTTPRYDKVQAELSWKRTIEFFKKHLG